MGDGTSRQEDGDNVSIQRCYTLEVKADHTTVPVCVGAATSEAGWVDVSHGKHWTWVSKTWI